jgi:16S rRNA (uracil1498-N3)-methyltransferase
MTQRRFYATRDAFASDAKSVTLSTDETKHLRNVLRLTVGEEVQVFDGEGHEYRSEIAAISRDRADLRIIQEVAPSVAESPLDLTMAVALLKGEKFDLVVQKLTELGVNRIIPVSTSRGDMRIRNDDEANRKLIRWQRIVIEATKQCGRARLLKIERPIGFDQFIASANGEMRVMFAETGGESFSASCERSNHGSVLALVGPEGGWTQDEINQTRDAGWRIITLGGRVMRAETAAIACAALLQHRFGDLN